MVRQRLGSDQKPADRRRAVWLGLCLCLRAAASTAASGEGDKAVYGWAEKVIIGPGGIELQAKLDTGADTSSLDAIDIRRLRRGRQRLVRFTVQDPSSGQAMTIERPLIRRVAIKRHGGEPQRRPVVALRVCLGEILQEIEVSLTDRSEFLYPLLLGRSALEGIAVVDPALTHTRRATCDMAGQPMRTVLGS